MEDLRDFDASLKSDDEAIPFEQAVNEIESRRDDL
jgi:hypothetical protein